MNQPSSPTSSKLTDSREKISNVSRELFQLAKEINSPNSPNSTNLTNLTDLSKSKTLTQQYLSTFDIFEKMIKDITKN